MADITTIKDEIADDEIARPINIKQKNGELYLAPESTEDTPVPCTVHILGTDAKKVQAARDKVAKKMLRSRRLTIDPADLRANRIYIAGAAITDWFGWTSGASPFPCTPTNVAAWLAAEHILEQVEAGVAAHADFSPPVSPT